MEVITMGLRQDDLDAFLADQQQDPKFAAAYEDARLRTELLASCVRLRKEHGHTQADVARAMGTTQSAVSDLEAGATDPQLSTLQRYTRAVGGELVVAVRSEPGAESGKSGAASSKRRRSVA
ncbi:MAG: helix-turn-helix domain-containing protein [Actinopolymorphaceae bacterium]